MALDFAALGLTWWMLLIIIWDLAWRVAAVWKSTRLNHPMWSVVFVLFQSVGILPILYIFLFSKMKLDEKVSKKRRKK
jgi:hypothetical protein